MSDNSQSPNGKSTANQSGNHDYRTDCNCDSCKLARRQQDKTIHDPESGRLVIKDLD